MKTKAKPKTPATPRQLPTYVKPRGSERPATLAGTWEGIKADYAAAKTSRFVRRRTGYVTTGSGADYHYNSEADWLKMVEYARDFDRNDTVVGMMADRATDNTVQSGLVMDPQTGDKALDRDIKPEWQGWSDDPRAVDIAGRHSFPSIQWFAERASLVDGDCFVLPLEGGSLQFQECHRCRTPSNVKTNVVHGVRLDAKRKPEAYYFTIEDVDPMSAMLKPNAFNPAYPAFDRDGNPLVLHVVNPKRMSQTRGVTAFAPVFAKLGMFEDIDFAKLVQQQIVSCFAILRMSDAPFRGGPVGQKGPRTEEEMTDGVSRLLEGIAPGLEIFGRPGERIEGFSPRVPNPEYFEQAKLILRLVAACLNVPLVSLLLDGSETNFTGWRGAINQAQIGWRRNQILLRDQLVLPVYRWKLRQIIAKSPAMRAAAKRGGIDIFGVRCTLPHWPYIQPEIDSAADELRIRAGLASPSRVAADRSQDYEDETDQTIADNRYRLEAALKAAEEMSTKWGRDIDPMQLIYLDPAKPLELAAPVPVTPFGGAAQVGNEQETEGGTDEDSAL